MNIVLTKDRFRSQVKDFLGITLGTLLCGIAFSIFLVPFKASPGGVGGLSQILFYFFNIPFGISMLIFNIPLFILGVFTLGKEFGVKTIFAILLLSGFSDLFSYRVLSKFKLISDFMVPVNPARTAYSLTNEYFLAVLAGSILLGVGVGIIIQFNGSTGGSDIPVLMMKKYLGISIGNGFLIVETIVIVFIGLTFKDGTVILLGLFSLYVSAKITDMIIEGYSRTKGVMVIPHTQQKAKLIKKYIKNDLERGYTILYSCEGHGSDGDRLEERDIIYIAVNRKELPKLKNNLKKIDERVFVIINDVYETYGTGFKRLP